MRASRRVAPRCARRPAGDRKPTRPPRRSCAPPPRLCLKRWPPFGDPALNGRLVALRSRANRLLRTPAGGTQQPADMIRIVSDMELLANDCCDAPGGPDLADEPIGFGTPGEQMRELCQLLGAQPGRGPGRWLAVPGFDISCARPLQPAANRALGNAHGLRDGGARPALL